MFISQWKGRGACDTYDRYEKVKEKEQLRDQDGDGNETEPSLK